MQTSRQISASCSAILLLAIAARPAAVAAGDAFPEHVQQAFDAYDAAADLIVDGRYDEAAAALEGLGKSLAAPYSVKAAAAARQLRETVVEPRFDARSSFQRGRQRIRAAEVCLSLHAYPAAADIFQEVVRDAVIAIEADAKIDVVRRAYRHAGSDAARYRDLFERCRAVDKKIYSRAAFEDDELAVGRRARDGAIAELVDELPAELRALGLEEFHWLRLRRLSDARSEWADDREQAQRLLDESAARIGDTRIAAISARVTQSVSVEAVDRERTTVANIERLLELGRIDAAALLCRDLIPVARDAETCFATVLATAGRLAEIERYDAALELYGGLVLAPQFGSDSDSKNQDPKLRDLKHVNLKHGAAVAAYHATVHRGDPQQSLKWAEMAVGQFRRGSVCGKDEGAIAREDAYLIAEARLRAEPNDATIDAGFDVLVRYGRFDGSIGPLIAAEYARRGTLDALERRIDRLAMEAAGVLGREENRSTERLPVTAEVVPGMRKQVELQRIRTAGPWEALWNRLVDGRRRVHQAFGVLPASPLEAPDGKQLDTPLDDAERDAGKLEDQLARQTAALLLERPNETPKKLRRVRNVDDVKLGWKLYFAAALGHDDAGSDIRARLETLAAVIDPNLLADYLDCLTAMAALPEKNRTELEGETRSTRHRLEQKLTEEIGRRPTPSTELKHIGRPRYLDD